MKFIQAASAVLCLSAMASAVPFDSPIAIPVKRATQPDPSRTTKTAVTFNSQFNGAYYGMVSVGTPAQTFPVMLDTGSADFWLYAGRGSKRVHHQLYYPNASSTNIDTKIASSITYGDGTVATFNWQNDTVSFGGRTVKTSIGAAFLDVNPGVTLGDVTYENTGLLGLAFPDDNTLGWYPPVAKMAKDKVIKNNVYGLYLGNEKNSTDGELTIGGYNPARFQASDLQWNSVKPVFLNATGPTRWWNVLVDNVKIGKTVHKTVLSNGKGNHGNASYVLDSGTSFMALPQAIVDELVSVTGATVDDSGYPVDCKRRATAPTLTFTIGGKAYDLPSTDYIGYDTTKVEEGSVCFLEVYAWSSPTFPFILGDTFLRRFYSIYDMDNRRTGLARAIHP
ncbi:Vacuolar protease A [Thoreauomyces humboldtii]|nr:Vacuolar protease A [Thoreauomyces humboldtii]